MAALRERMQAAAAEEDLEAALAEHQEQLLAAVAAAALAMEELEARARLDYRVCSMVAAAAAPALNLEEEPTIQEGLLLRINIREELHLPC